MLSCEHGGTQTRFAVKGRGDVPPLPAYGVLACRHDHMAAAYVHTLPEGAPAVEYRLTHLPLRHFEAVFQHPVG